MFKAVFACLILLIFIPEASARALEQPSFQEKSDVSLHGRRHLMDEIDAHARQYIVQPNDTLKKIARTYGTTVEFIKHLNRIKSNRLKIGQKLLISDVTFIVEINTTLNRLYLKVGDVLIKEYPVATGKSGTETPVGSFFIQSRYPYPTWFHKGVVIPGGAPDNYLGSRWLGLDKPQYGIHGTIFPEQIGHSVSKGCVRMKNEDVEELYEVIPIGTRVVITDL